MVLKRHIPDSREGSTFQTLQLLHRLRGASCADTLCLRVSTERGSVEGRLLPRGALDYPEHLVEKDPPQRAITLEMAWVVIRTRAVGSGVDCFAIRPGYTGRLCIRLNLQRARISCCACHFIVRLDAITTVVAWSRDVARRRFSLSRMCVPTVGLSLARLHTNPITSGFYPSPHKSQQAQSLKTVTNARSDCGRDQTVNCLQHGPLIGQTVSLV